MTRRPHLGDAMLYMTAGGGSLKIVILETANLERMKAGHPAKTPDGSVLVAWTPDPVWLADQIMATDGDAVRIGQLIDEASKRPEKPSGRASHGPHVKTFLGDES